jgi:hypothetical protein
LKVAVQEADRDGFHPCGPELADALAHLVLLERNEDVAVRHGHALLHRQPVAALDEGPRLPGQLLLEREVERLLVTGDVEDVAHALGRDHPDLGSRVRERDVRRHRRAVQEVVDLGEVDAGLAAQLADAVHDAAGGVVGSGGDLVDGDPARLLVDEGQVRECAAHVDSDALHPVPSLPAVLVATAEMISRPTVSIWSKLPLRYAHEISSMPRPKSSCTLARTFSAEPAIAKSSMSSPVR